jgi:PAS domain S-box-containing protein
MMLEMTGPIREDRVSVGDQTFRNLIDRSAQGILVECGSRPVYANDACARILGFTCASMLLDRPDVAGLFADPALVGRTATGLVDTPGVRTHSRITVRADRPDGSTAWVDLLIQPTQWHGITALQYTITDVTERRRCHERARRLQMQLVDSARLNAMREVANSLSHRLNQPRGAMLNYLNTARRLLHRDACPHQVMQVLDRLAGEADRAYRVIAEVESVFDHDPDEMRASDLRGIVEEAVDAARVDAFTRNVALDLDIPADLPEAALIRPQFQHVILTLVRSAVEAFEDEPVRRVTVSARSVGSEKIRIEIADTVDAAPARAGHEPGELELTVCRSIIAAHGGRLDRGGTGTFAFTLPAVAPATVGVGARATADA